MVGGGLIGVGDRVKQDGWWEAEVHDGGYLVVRGFHRWRMGGSHSNGICDGGWRLSGGCWLEGGMGLW